MARIENAKSINEWLDQRIGIETLRKVMQTEYWIPKNINFLWAMGMVLAATFGILTISGIFLLMYYNPSVDLAFDSVNYKIMTEVGYGWLWRHIHGVGASLVFLIIYIHMFTGIYYGSYKKGRELIWISGMLLFVLFSAEAFSGYMLPWGQMSYWAGMVITNLFAGGSLEATGFVEWIRGDYIPAQAFLTRFFMLHVFLMPLLIIYRLRLNCRLFPGILWRTKKILSHGFRTIKSLFPHWRLKYRLILTWGNLCMLGFIQARLPRVRMC
jgi:ubiquinol-cytochrome c reductase cytochrome b subunit